MRWILLIVLSMTLTCTSFILKAQQNLVSKSIQLNTETVIIDSLPVLKPSLKVYLNQTLLTENIHYAFNYGINELRSLKIPLGSTLILTYQTILVNLRKPLFNKDTAIILPEFTEQKNPFLYVPKQGQLQLFNNDGLAVTGSIMRGLSIGNNQNAVVNANLNLQFSGKVNNDIDVLAAISDDNNPIQPEGNTQDLQDFDKVFVQFSKDSNMLVVGDYLVTQPQPGYFLNYYKKSRGLLAQTKLNLTKQSQLNSSVSVALSRGRFVRNVINGVEGNQGPYRLTGPNGELFIIIVSGTEAVYLNGERLSRGEQNDYTIDYNTGEVTFTPKRLINNYSRIVVEFQYSDRNYARTMVTTNHALNYKKATFYLNYFLEQDNKNQPFQQQLTDSSKQVLAQAGNNLSQAVISSAVLVNGYNAGKILYRKIDTLSYSNIYVYAPSKGNDSIFYEVKFSFTGAKRGNYIQTSSTANGRVFAWVEPINGEPQGDFEPVTQLIAPNSQQLISAGVNYQLSKQGIISVEGAASTFNRNLYSNLDKQNDVGYGVKVIYKNQVSINKKITWDHLVNYEWVDKNFRYIERYRSVEFDRIWNRQLVNNATTDTGFNEHILFAGTGLDLNKILSFNYQLGIYTRNSNAFNGLQHQLSSKYQLKKTNAAALLELQQTKLNALNPIENNTYRYQVNLKQLVSDYYVQGDLTSEQSAFKVFGDSLLPTSFFYNQMQYKFGNNDTARKQYYLGYLNRKDLQAKQNEFKDFTVAHEVTGSYSLLQNNLNRLNINANYRYFKRLDTVASGQLPVEQTLVTRIEYDYGLFNRNITANSYLVIGSGNELRRDFQFFEVPPGQGIYVWRDFNSDGVQQINEFILASATDRPLANYIKIILPSTSVIRTQTTQISQTLNMQTPFQWKNRGVILSTLSHFNTQTAYYNEQKSRSDGSFNIDQILPYNLPDTALINSQENFRNTIFFNRANPIFGADWMWQQSESKVLLTNGFESRLRKENTINLRYNLNRSFTFNGSLGFGSRAAFTQLFVSNNYRYTFEQYGPKLTYQYGNNFRASLLYNYFEANNLPDFGSENTFTHETGTELRYSITKIGVLSAKYSYYEIVFNGLASSPLAYDMLQGLLPGSNQVWSINLQQRIGNNLQINLNYDGRKNGAIPAVHIGRMEARYIF